MAGPRAGSPARRGNRNKASNRNKAKGTRAETAVVSYLTAHGWPHAERRAQATGQHGTDAGDITGTPALAWEVRARRRLDLLAWLRDAAARRRAARADIALLVIKPDGLGTDSIAGWPVVLTLADACQLLRSAGYGSPVEAERSTPAPPAARRP
jgi:hypothetical protein